MHETHSQADNKQTNIRTKTNTHTTNACTHILHVLQQGIKQTTQEQTHTHILAQVEHTLLDAKFKKKSAIQKQMNQHVSVY